MSGFDRVPRQTLYSGVIEFSPRRRRLTRGKWLMFVILPLFAVGWIIDLLVDARRDQRLEMVVPSAPQTPPSAPRPAQHSEPEVQPSATVRVVQTQEYFEGGKCYCPKLPCDCPAGSLIIEEERPPIRRLSRNVARR